MNRGERRRERMRFRYMGEKAIERNREIDSHKPKRRQEMEKREKERRVGSGCWFILCYLDPRVSDSGFMFNLRFFFF